MNGLVQLFRARGIEPHQNSDKLDTYRKLLRVRYFMTKKNGKLRTLDETIKELIEFWAKHAP